jgi:hypothetical protein
LSIWPQLIDFSEKLAELFDNNFDKIQETEKIQFSGWSDTFWSGENVRKCHLKTIDNRNTQKMWLLHINIFPSITNDSPILGFDIVAGENKITGSFFDFSPINPEHQLTKEFHSITTTLSWNKPRELPDWAKSIFSSDIIAVGNIREDELEQLLNVTYELTELYTSSIIRNPVEYCTDENLIKEKHNFYCQQQKKNPHLHRSILSMGISEKDKDEYVNRILFEEI